MTKGVVGAAQVRGLRVVVYGPLAELVFGHVHKGSRLGIIGHIQQRYLRGGSLTFEIVAEEFEKSELAFESPRLLDWEARRKLLLVTSLVHAFLILLLAPRFERLKLWLLNTWCKRFGKWSRETPTPLYRLHLALAHLWQYFPPVSFFC